MVGHPPRADLRASARARNKFASPSAPQRWPGGLRCSGIQETGFIAKDISCEACGFWTMSELTEAKPWQERSSGFTDYGRPQAHAGQARWLHALGKVTAKDIEMVFKHRDRLVAEIRARLEELGGEPPVSPRPEALKRERRRNVERGYRRRRARHGRHRATSAPCGHRRWRIGRRSQATGEERRGGGRSRRPGDLRRIPESRG